MTQFELIDILIVGAGPAGMSTALHLLRADPAWAGRVVVVDKAVHPREKLCGGGVTHLGEAVLDRLGLAFEPAHLPVRQLQLVYQDLRFAIYDDPVFRVVRRDEFDHWLVRCGQRQGLNVRQGEAVVDVVPGPDYIEVLTDRAAWRARVVVVADGSRSFVRQRLKWDNGSRVARLLEVLTPESADALEFRQGIATLDFSPMAVGVQGYYWDFPSLVQGRPFMNRGVFDSRTRPERPRVALKETLKQALARRERNLEDYPLKGHPIHWFDSRASLARPRIILVGDAAGVDPLLGEGISFALGYGEVAAAAVMDALARQDFRFADYNRRVQSHPILTQLRMRTFLARIAYLLRSHGLIYGFWRFSPILVTLLAWYNRDYVPLSSPRLVRLER